MQSGGGIVDTGNQQTVDGDKSTRSMSDLYALTGLLWKEPGYKVAWIEIEKPSLCALRKNVAAIGFRASRTRVELATCEF
jgi:hypothetical protein